MFWMPNSPHFQLITNLYCFNIHALITQWNWGFVTCVRKSSILTASDKARALIETEKIARYEY